MDTKDVSAAAQVPLVLPSSQAEQATETPVLSESDPSTSPQATQTPVASSTPRPELSPELSVISVLVLAVLAALVAGLAEATSYIVQRFVLGIFMHTSTQAIWAALVFDLGTAMLLALPFVFLALRSKHCREDLVVTLCGFCVTWAIASCLPGMALYAKLILAVGVAVQLNRWCQNNPGVALRRSQRVLPWLFAASCGLFLMFGPPLSYASKRPRMDAAPGGEIQPSDDTQPNVLLLVMDTVRADAIGTSAEHTRTPNIGRLAEAGFVFRQARATSPWTLPSHAGLLTGRMPSQLDVGWNESLGKTPTVAEWLQSRGYRTGAFVANRWYCSAETGLDHGFDYYDDFEWSFASLVRASAWSRQLDEFVRVNCLGIYSDERSRRSAKQINAQATAWIEANDGPYFAMLNYFDAHDPYFAPEVLEAPPSNSEAKELKRWWLSDKTQLDEQAANFQFTAYKDCVRYLDSQVGALIDRLDRMGKLENTIVIVTSDHGEHFGDHELFGHGNSLYDASIHVPLILWSKPTEGLKRWVPNGTSDLPASLASLPASIVGFVVGADSPSEFPGLPLQNVWNHEKHLGPVVSEIELPSKWPACGGRSPVFRGAMQSVVLGRWKYIQTGDDEFELYDLKTDPAEQFNVYNEAETGLISSLQEALRDALHAPSKEQP